MIFFIACKILVPKFAFPDINSQLISHLISISNIFFFFFKLFEWIYDKLYVGSIELVIIFLSNLFLLIQCTHNFYLMGSLLWLGLNLLSCFWFLFVQSDFILSLSVPFLSFIIIIITNYFFMVSFSVFLLGHKSSLSNFEMI